MGPFPLEGEGAEGVAFGESLGLGKDAFGVCVGVLGFSANYICRKPKHDMGSVENIVRQYQRKRAALGTGGSKGRDAAKKNNTKRGRK